MLLPGGHYLVESRFPRNGNGSPNESTLTKEKFLVMAWVSQTVEEKAKLLWSNEKKKEGERKVARRATVSPRVP